MKKGFTLIELIITIVIMAGVFATIPKILSAAGRSNAFTIRQDALMQAVSLTSIASRLAWDENNTNHLDILQTNSSAFECNTTLQFRPGSYVSANGRMCTQPISATTHLAAESGENDYTLYDDIDDFEGSEVNIIYKGIPKYRLTNSVTYLDDNIVTDDGNKITINLSSGGASATSTAIKSFTSKVSYVGKRGKERNISSFYYYSTNIGQISLASRNWQ